MTSEREAKEKIYVEQVGLFFEQSGLPPMAGRVLGWLLICDPPQQSPSELGKALMASKGSISTATRLLIQIGLIERINLPGIRHDYFRIKPGAWRQMLQRNLEQVTVVRRLAEQGLELAGGKSALTRQWLEDMRSLYCFFEKELPLLMERWDRARTKHQANQRG